MMQEKMTTKKEVPAPVIIAALVVLVGLIVWYGYVVMNKSQEGVTPPAEAHRMMMNYMKRGGSPSGASAAGNRAPTSKPSP